MDQPNAKTLRKWPLVLAVGALATVLVLYRIDWRDADLMLRAALIIGVCLMLASPLVWLLLRMTLTLTAGWRGPVIRIGLAGLLTGLVLGAGAYIALWILQYFWLGLYAFFDPRLLKGTGILILSIILALLVLVVFVALSIRRQEEFAGRLLFLWIGSMVERGLSPTAGLADPRAVGGSRGLSILRNRLMKLLEAGCPLGEAIGQVVPGVTRRQKALLASAESRGILGPILVQESKALEDKMRSPDRSLGIGLAVVQWLCLVFMVLFIGVFIGPKFEVLAMDFGMSISGIVLLWIKPESALYFCMFVMVMLTVGAVFWDRSHWLTGWCRRPTWCLYVPVIGSTIEKSDMADVSAYLGASLGVGVGFVDALQGASELDLNRRTRARLLAWRQGVIDGRSPADAARDAGFSDLFSGFVRLGQAGAGPAEPLARLGEFYRREAQLLSDRLGAAWLPLLTVVAGVITASIVVSLFVLMTRYLGRLT